MAASAANSTPGFEPNLGQAEGRYRYLARAGQARIFIEDTKLAVAAGGDNVRFEWMNAAVEGGWAEYEATGNRRYYCNNPNIRLCRTAIPSYRRVVRGNIYRGIDWVLHGRESNTEYDLILHPGADINQARLRVDAPTVTLEGDGRLRAGSVVHWRPEAYQWVDGRKVAVEVSLYEAGEREFGFRVGTYRPDVELTIDPVIEAMTVVGAEEEDEVRGSSNSSCSYRYGVTSGGSWNTARGSRGRDVFVQQVVKGTGLSSTIFWGGEGDEQVSAGASDGTNCFLVLVGWTSSRNAPLVSSYEFGAGRPYAGGTTDGFLLKVAGDEVSYASYVGGHGEDRLYDVRYLSAPGSGSRVGVVGETDDAAWEGALTGRVGPGGKVDAIAGLINGSELSVVAIGGTGNDRLRRLRASGRGVYIAAGETDSPDFPLVAGSKAAAGKDVWIGQARFDPLGVAPLALLGGAGDDSVAGLAVIADQGIYVAGTTGSTDLPAATGTYGGGPTDGYVAWLDGTTGAPRAAVYLGGTGRDEIEAMAEYEGDLYLGGATDSRDLALPGVAAGEAFGGMDGLFVACSGLLDIERAVRFGGPADDRVLGIEGWAGGVRLVGASQSAEWLTQSEWQTAGLGKTDGFEMVLKYAAIRFREASTPGGAVPSVLDMGRDLEMRVSLQVISEPGMDGLVRVRSADPSRLVVGAGWNGPPTDQILLRDADRVVGSNLPGPVFTLRALADEGEVDLIVEGRAAGTSARFYPRKRLRVRLRPAGLFFDWRSEQRVTVNSTFQVGFHYAAILEDGSTGRAMQPGDDIASPVRLIADSDAVQIDETPNGNVFRVVTTREGTYVLTLQSPHFRAAPGEALRVVAQPNASALFDGTEFVLTKDHFVPMWLSDGVAGDRLRVTTDDVSRVGITTGMSSINDSVTVNFPPGAVGGLQLVGRSGEGSARVRVDGTYRGRPIAQEVTIRLRSYSASLYYGASVVGVGVPFQVGLSLTPYPYYSLSARGMSGEAVWADAFSGLRLRSSDEAVIEVTAQNSGQLNFRAVGRRLGSARLEFAPGAPAEFAGIQREVRVVTARVDFGELPLRVPAGATVPLERTSMEATASAESLKRVRLRVPNGSRLRVGQWAGEAESDLTLDWSNGRSMVLNAQDAAPGTFALLVSAPDIPEYEVPVRITEPVLVPSWPEREVTIGSGESPTASYQLAAYDEGQVYRMRWVQGWKGTLRARVSATPGGICTFPETVESDNGGLSVPLNCGEPGVVTLALEPLAGLASAQPRYTMRIVVRRQPVSPLFMTGRVFTGNGVQTQMAPPWNSVRFEGTLTSSDPDKVRLSLDAKAPGTASVRVTEHTVGDVFVQGYSSEGTVTITAVRTDGRKDEVTVYLFPATMALRPASQLGSPGDVSDQWSIDQPLSAKDLTLDIRPSLVEPQSGKIFWPYGLAVRGGTDPMYVRGQSGNATVVEPGSGDAIVNENDVNARINFKVKAAGEAVLSVVQPPGFVAVADSALRVRVMERELIFGSNTPVLSPDLQTAISVYPASGDSDTRRAVTLTSLDPSKIVIAGDASTAGAGNFTTELRKAVYLQALPAAVPGDRIRIRLEAADFKTSEREVIIARATLGPVTQGPITIEPETTTNLLLPFGPRNTFGQVLPSFNGGLRPGASLALRVTSSNPAVLEAPAEPVRLERDVQVQLRAVRPGAARVYLEIDPSVDNQAASVAAVVRPYQFTTNVPGPAASFLVSNFTVANPSSQAVTMTAASTGQTPVRLGTTASGAGQPSAGALTVTLPARRPGVFSPTTVFVEPAAIASNGMIRLTADEFEDRDLYLNIAAPRLLLAPTGPLNLSLAARTTVITVALGAFGGRELPLGTSFGALDVTMESSNSQVVRVGTARLTFAPGEIRKTVTVELVGRGQSTITASAPARFTGPNPERQGVVINVQ